MMYSTKATVNFATDIRKDVFAKIETFSSINRDSFGTGKLLTIVTNDITSIQSAMTMTLRVLVRAFTVIYRKYNYCFVTARELFPILLVVVPILLLAIILIASKASGTFKRCKRH